MPHQWLCSAFLILSFTSPAYTADCIPTSHRTTGTHYEPVTRQQVNVSKGVVVSGQVLSSTDCNPVANARVAHWQAGEDGHYSDRLRAYLYTDENGHYEFETEWPNLDPPHIHFIVNANGFNVLETQWIATERINRINFNMVLEVK